MDRGGHPVRLVPPGHWIRHHQTATGCVVGVPRGVLHEDRLNRYVLQGDASRCTSRAHRTCRGHGGRDSGPRKRDGHPALRVLDQSL